MAKQVGFFIDQNPDERPSTRWQQAGVWPKLGAKKCLKRLYKPHQNASAVDVQRVEKNLKIPQKTLEKTQRINPKIRKDVERLGGQTKSNKFLPLKKSSGEMI